MSWDNLLGLLIKFGPQGFELAKSIINKWSNSNPVTIADIEELRALGQNTARSQMLDALNRAGVPVDSPQAVALLALVP